VPLPTCSRVPSTIWHCQCHKSKGGGGGGGAAASSGQFVCMSGLPATVLQYATHRKLTKDDYDVLPHRIILLR
jgi:hypothetical protein